jgi:hypothetical protein
MGLPEQQHDRSAPEEAVLYEGWESAARGGSDADLLARCAAGHNRIGGLGTPEAGLTF